MKQSNLELAAQIFWGEYVDHDLCHLTNCGDNPENQYMIKESIEKLSEEAKFLLSVIYDLPDVIYNRMMGSSGALISTEIDSWMKRAHKWSDRKIALRKRELSKCFGEAI